MRDDGHDSVHVRDLGLQAAEDEVLLELAAKERRVLVSADTDFAALLARRTDPGPSVILFRHGAEHRPQLQVELLRANLAALAEALEAGAIATIEPTRIRVRQLPLA